MELIIVLNIWVEGGMDFKSYCFYLVSIVIQLLFGNMKFGLRLIMYIYCICYFVECKKKNIVVSNCCIEIWVDFWFSILFYGNC